MATVLGWLVRIVLVLIVLVGVQQDSACAEPVRITGGYFVAGGTFGVDLGLYTGGEGPDLYVGEGRGRPPEGFREFFCPTCSPPQTKSQLHLIFDPTEVGDPSSNSLCPGCGYGGDFTFLTVAGPIPSADQPFRAPFTMSGVFQGFAPDTGQRIFRHVVEGSGTMAVVASPFNEFPFAVLFGFDTPAQVPEPSSGMLLVAGALAGAVRRAARGGPGHGSTGRAGG